MCGGYGVGFGGWNYLFGVLRLIMCVQKRYMETKNGECVVAGLSEGEISMCII